MLVLGLILPYLPHQGQVTEMEKDLLLRVSSLIEVGTPQQNKDTISCTQ